MVKKAMIIAPSSLVKVRNQSHPNAEVPPSAIRTLPTVCAHDLPHLHEDIDLHRTGIWKCTNGWARTA